jgi:hypothetical protein
MESPPPRIDVGVPEDRLVLAAGARLAQEDAGQLAWLEFDHQPRVPLNSTAALLLSLCDGSRTLHDVVATAGREPRTDVEEFLSTALALGWIEPVLDF